MIEQPHIEAEDVFVFELDPNLTNGEADWTYSLKSLHTARRASTG